MLGPSLLFGERSRAELFSEKASRAELFVFKTEPNRAFGFPKLSYFWLFSVEFFKEYNFLDEKTHFYWCLQDYTLKNWQKCWKSAHFLFLKVTRFFEWWSKPSWTKLFDKASPAEPSFFQMQAEPSFCFQNRAKPSFRFFKIELFLTIFSWLF